MNSSKYALVLAIFLGVLAAFGVHQHLNSATQEAANKVRPVLVVFAKENIQEGTEIRGDLLETREFPSAYQFDQLCLESDIEKDLIGKVANSSIPRGNPIEKRDVEPRAGPAPSTGIPNGKRAFTLPIDAITGVAGMLKPGNTVDVLGHFKETDPRASAKGGGQSTSSIVMLENLSVLAVGAQAGRRWGSRRDAQADISSVTLSVTPEQATLLFQVLKEGSISLMLRRDGEFTPAVPPAVDSQNLMRTIARLRGEAGGGR